MNLYENCLGFFAELAGAGVRDVVVSPGSRSTPLAISARFTPGLDVHVNIDERAAGFFALGLSKASRRPVVLICTSGSAAANYLPAVVEADLSGVPLIVLTADRPPELRRWGAGQTIDQTGLYGTHVRSYAELPCGRDGSEAFFRRAGARCVLDSTRSWPGPVHRNMPFREPLEPSGALPSVRPSLLTMTPTVATPDGSAMADVFAQLASVECGVVLVGPSDLEPNAVDDLLTLAVGLGWPVIADPASQVRFDHPERVVIAHGDLLLRSAAFSARNAPDAVLRLGASPTSKPARLWLEAAPPASLVLITEPGRWEEPSFTATSVIEADPAAALAALADLAGATRSSSWLDDWRRADALVADLVAELDRGHLTELLVARVFSDIVDGPVVAASSMPIRDLDTTMGATHRRRVLVNRGANGIDGLVATAAGASSVLGRTHLLIGDVAVLHDIGSVLEAGRSRRPLTLVLVDNDGGGIFSMLPVAAHGDAVDFEALFTTPHGADFAALANFAGVTVTQPDSAQALADALRAEVEGLHVVHVVVDRAESLQQRRALAAAVDRALTD